MGSWLRFVGGRTRGLAELTKVENGTLQHWEVFGGVILGMRAVLLLIVLESKYCIQNTQVRRHRVSPILLVDIMGVVTTAHVDASTLK